MLLYVRQDEQGVRDLDGLVAHYDIEVADVTQGHRTRRAAPWDPLQRVSRRRSLNRVSYTRWRTAIAEPNREERGPITALLSDLTTNPSEGDVQRVSYSSGSGTQHAVGIRRESLRALEALGRLVLFGADKVGRPEPLSADEIPTLISHAGHGR
jgi:hypothetical protein